MSTDIFDLDLAGYEVDAAGTYTGTAPPILRRHIKGSTMGLKATAASGGDFKPVPPGMYPAICVDVLDLGTQTSEKFGTASHKVRIAWEVHGDDDAGNPLVVTTHEGDTVPMTIGAEYTVSLNEKANLRKMLASWRGRDFTESEMVGFDIDNVLGAACMLNITNSTNANTGRTYANIAAVAPMPRSMPRPERQHKLRRLDLDNPDMDVFDSLPEWVKDRIEDSPEWQGRGKAAQVRQPALVDGDDDVPF